MKSTIKYILPLLFFITACEDLELQPENAASEENFYTTAANLQTGLYGIYDALQLTGVCGIDNLEGMSDNCITDQSFGPDINAYAAGQQVIATTTVKRMYRDNYTLIQRANLLLDKIDEISGVSDEDREMIRAEAKALRAFAYMKLVYYFGGVPLLEHFTGREEVLTVSRATREEIINFVLEEFNATATVLESSPAGDGRLTKQIVLGLRARVMLYEARMGNQSWQDALTAINLAVTEADNGGHGLIDTDSPAIDYQSIFMEANEGNKEIIFSVHNSLNDKAFGYAGEYSWVAGHLRMHIHQNLADAYPYADGSPYNPADDNYEGRDPRLSTNIMHRGLTFDGTTYDGTDEGGFVGGNSLGSATNLFFYKFATTDFTSGLNVGQLDIPLLRYADLLLMQAEALNETNADGSPAINKVRDRAGLPALTGLSQSQMRDAIILERRLELALEGQRWHDLITLGIAESVINAIVEEDPIITRAFTPNRSELLPIPQTEIAQNPNLTQNPGY